MATLPDNTTLASTEGRAAYVLNIRQRLHVIEGAHAKIKEPGIPDLRRKYDLLAELASEVAISIGVTRAIELNAGAHPLTDLEAGCKDCRRAKLLAYIAYSDRIVGDRRALKAQIKEQEAEAAKRLRELKRLSETPAAAVAPATT